MTQKRGGALGVVSDIILYTLIAIAIVIPFRFFVAQPFIVSGASMVPTFHMREYLVIDLATYRIRDIERGEVVVFRYPFDPSLYFVKRIIGLPNEVVEIRNGVVSVRTVGGEIIVLNEPYISSENRTQESNTTTLGENEYFVMGDNRSGSSDSRVWGPLQKKFISGRVLMRLYPLSTFEYLPGEHKY